jgi:phosphoribosylformimino-5-aminoimidazole carboxamide ribotide isomerase
MALHWQSLSATRLHVVDLDGARWTSGQRRRRGRSRAVTIPVELGGDVRDLATIERWLVAGIDRVFLGTAATERTSSRACRLFRHGSRRRGCAQQAHRGAGWRSIPASPRRVRARIIEAGVYALAYTDVSRWDMRANVEAEGGNRRAAPHGADVLAGGMGPSMTRHAATLWAFCRDHWSGAV